MVIFFIFVILNKIFNHYLSHNAIFYKLLNKFGDEYTMMNKIWGVLIILSIITALFTGNNAELSSGIIDTTSTAIELIFTIGGMMCLWSGIMNIAEKSGLTKALAKAFSPILCFLFPEYKDKENVMGAISMNITANLLGLGNAATPFGIRAISEMSKYSTNKKTAGDSMIAFVVLNTASIQLIPTTIAALRRSAGSNEPMSILPFVWISSICALFVGLSLSRILGSNDKIRRL